MRDKLADIQVKNATADGKPKRLYDGAGLYVQVNPNGSKWWRLKYRYGGREKLLALGVYPDVTLKRAREKRDEARQLLDRGIDPAAQRKLERAARAVTFEDVAKEFFASKAKELAPQTIARDVDRLTKFVYPHIGARPIAELTAPEFLECFRRIEKRDLLNSLERCKSASSRIMRYAIVTGRAERDPVADLKGAFPSRKAKHHAAQTEPKAVGELMRAIHGYNGHLATVAALKLAPLVFVRPSELRLAEWTEFDLDAENPVWRIPARRMKMKDVHLVPLSTQAVEILKELRNWHRSRYLFPSLRTNDRPMSNNTINAALRRMGYTKDEMTGHGFRTIASTLLNEAGFDPDAIELQLDHRPRDNVRDAYNRARKLKERRELMQAWADYLDRLRKGGQVISFPKRSAGQSDVA